MPQNYVRVLWPDVWLPNILSPYATWAYSRIRPPSRSRRVSVRERTCLDGGPLPAGQPAVLVTGSAGTAGGARQLPAPGMPA